MKLSFLYAFERAWVALALAVALLVLVVLLVPVLATAGARKALVALWAAAQPYLPIAKERAKVAALVAGYPGIFAFAVIVRGIPAALRALADGVLGDVEYLRTKWQGLHLS